MPSRLIKAHLPKEGCHQGSFKAHSRGTQGAIKPISALNPLLTHPGSMHRIRSDRVVHIRQVDRLRRARARDGAPELQHRVRERVAELRGREHPAHLWGREGAVVSTCMRNCADGSTAPTDEPLQKPHGRRVQSEVISMQYPPTSRCRSRTGVSPIRPGLGRGAASIGMRRAAPSCLRRTAIES